MTPETEKNRAAFRQFIDQVIVGETAVKGIVGVGSIATGHMHARSDIDAIVFLDPLDLYIVPAEATWQPTTDTFYSSLDEQIAGLRLEFTRLYWPQWVDPEFKWPEERRSEMALGWIAYDPEGLVQKLINDRATFSDELRLQRLDEALIWLDKHLGAGVPEALWAQIDPHIAHDRLHTAYDYLVQALFAYNRHWRVWRNREMTSLLRLPWLPADFPHQALQAANSSDLNEAGYLARIAALRHLFDALRTQLIESGDYSAMPIDQAFLRYYEEPGRPWNIDDWNKFRRARQLPPAD